MSSKINKRGDVRDVFLVIIIFFVFGIGFFTVYYGYNKAVDIMKNNSAVNTTNVNTVLDNSRANVGDRLDYVMFALLMGMAIALVITSFLVDFHTIFFWIMVMVDMILVVVASILSYAWVQLSTKPIFGTFATTKFPIMNHILTNFPVYAAIIGLLSLAIMYMKPYFTGDG